MKKNFSAKLIVIMVLAFSLSGVSASAAVTSLPLGATEVYTETFELGYTLNTNLIPVSVDTANATTTDAKQVIIRDSSNNAQWMFRGMNASALSTDNVVMVVDGSVVGRSGNVLKIQEDPSPEGNSSGKRGNVMVNRIPGTGSGLAHVAGAELHIKQSMYIDSDTLSNVNTTTDSHGAFVSVPVSANNYYSRSSALTSIDTTNYMKAKANVGNVVLPKGSWFDIEYVIDLTDTANPVFDLYVEGTMIKENITGNALTAFFGISTGVMGAGGTVSPTIYIDDMQAYYYKTPYVVNTGSATKTFSNGSYTVSGVTFNKNTSSNLGETFILALYNQNKLLIGFDTYNFTDATTGNHTVPDLVVDNLSGISESDIASAKLMFWNSLSGMIPYVASTELIQ